MRVLKSVAAAVALICLVSVLSTRVMGQQGEPPLDNTIEWITAKVNDEGAFRFRDGSSWFREEHKIMGFSACTLKVETHRKFIELQEGSPTVTVRFDTEYPLKELSPDVKVRPSSERRLAGNAVYYVELNTTGRPAISVRVRESKGLTLTFDETKKTSKGSFGQFSTEDTAQRVAKALSHAITLCGGKKELF